MEIKKCNKMYVSCSIYRTHKYVTYKNDSTKQYAYMLNSLFCFKAMLIFYICASFLMALKKKKRKKRIINTTQRTKTHRTPPVTCMWHLSGWIQMGFWQISASAAGHLPSSRVARSRAADYERDKKTGRLDGAHTLHWWSDYSSHFLIRGKHLEEDNQAFR